MTATRTMDWTPRERLLAGLCVISLGFSIAAYFDFGGSAGAAPRGSDGPITSEDIPKGTIRGSDIAGGTITSADVRNGSLRAGDLDIYTAFGPSESVGGVQGFRDFTRAECRRGDRVLSGGYINSDPRTVSPIVFQPDLAPPDGWFLEVLQNGQIPTFIHAFAVCMN